MGKVQRADKHINRELIKDAVLTEFHATGKMPSQASVARKLQLDPTTVNRHWKKLADDFSSQIAPYKTLIPSVIEGVYARATDVEKGTAADAKLFLQVVGGVLGGEDTNRSDGITINVIASSDSETNIQVNNS